MNSNDQRHNFFDFLENFSEMLYNAMTFASLDRKDSAEEVIDKFFNQHQYLSTELKDLVRQYVFDSKNYYSSYLIYQAGKEYEDQQNGLTSDLDEIDDNPVSVVEYIRNALAAVKYNTWTLLANKKINDPVNTLIANRVEFLEHQVDLLLEDVYTVLGIDDEE